MRRIDDDLWVTERALRFGGVEIGTRMTVVRLPSQRLFLHSPVALDAPLRQTLETLGAPRYAVAPNRYHHLFIGAYADAYAQLQIFVAPGLDRKRPNLPATAVLGDVAPAEWRDHLDQAVVRGYPLFNEVVFYHRATRTLIVTDLVFNIRGDSPALTRWMFRLIGGYEGCGPTWIERLLVRDRAAACASLEHILRWDFERVILAHGHVLERGGREAVRHGYRWLLDRRG